jgi:hypothetical protein
MTASEIFWRMPSDKSEDLQSKPQDLIEKKNAQPQAADFFHGSG